LAGVDLAQEILRNSLLGVVVKDEVRDHGQYQHGSRDNEDNLDYPIPARFFDSVPL
jgi:hypothetical protein